MTTKPGCFYRFLNARKEYCLSLTDMRVSLFIASTMAFFGPIVSACHQLPENFPSVTDYATDQAGIPWPSSDGGATGAAQAEQAIKDRAAKCNPAVNRYRVSSYKDANMHAWQPFTLGDRGEIYCGGLIAVYKAGNAWIVDDAC